ncbi:glycosyltransferase [Candidatus Odyssella thessalonicensis]|uniref:glycosyltransferase n=1 Tax=Candidatus Odyssella thessalonicensis TaxID=84647 RepID=UPI000225B4BF|nr:glycosyltransferase [Candidatus Odyssella thessalonicensis]
MRIINLMLSRGRGGIEQAFVNSAYAVNNFSPFEQLCIIDQQSTVASQLTFPVQQLRQFADWDPLAIYRLHKMIQTFKPDLILCHGNRPLKMVLRAKSLFGINGAQIVGFCHNFSVKYLLKADAVISVSRSILESHILGRGFPPQKAFHIPNMIDLTHYSPVERPSLTPPFTIGTMGRFVKKKGFEDFIRAVKILKEAGINMTAILGGGGDEEAHLKTLARNLGLEGTLTFPGWIHDKRAFYQQLDLFCLPSREEPFGIIALDTLAFGVPMAATRTSGPLEFLIDGQNAILCHHSHPEDLAAALMKALSYSDRQRQQMVENGFQTVKNYDLPTISQQMVDALATIKSLSSR